MQRSILLIVILPALLLLPVGTLVALQPLRIATLSGSFVSMTSTDNGTIMLLESSGEMSMVAPDGKVTYMSLPPLADGTSPDDWNDLAWAEQKVLLVRFNHAAYYRFDPTTPDTLDVVPLNGFTSERPLLAEISCTAQGIYVVDAQSGTYRVDEHNRVHLQSHDIVPLYTADGNILRVVSNLTVDNRPWAIYAGASLLCQRTAELPTDSEQPTDRDQPQSAVSSENGQTRLQLLKPLGFTNAGWLLALEGRGKGELDVQYRLLVVADGKVLHSLDLPQLSSAAMVRKIVSGVGNEVLFLACDDSGKQELLKFALP